MRARHESLGITGGNIRVSAGSLWQRSKHKRVLLTEKSAPQSAGQRCGGEAWEAEGSGAGRRVAIGGNCRAVSGSQGRQSGVINRIAVADRRDLTRGQNGIPQILPREQRLAILRPQRKLGIVSVEHS